MKLSFLFVVVKCRLFKWVEPDMIYFEFRFVKTKGELRGKNK